MNHCLRKLYCQILKYKQRPSVEEYCPKASYIYISVGGETLALFNDFTRNGCLITKEGKNKERKQWIID